MKFFFRGDGKPTKDYRVLHQSMDRQLQACKDYQRHLDAISPKLPDVARSFISTPWYYDFNHHDCPHDSWLMDLSLKVGVKCNDDRTLDLTLNLLGAYHDRILIFHYRNVTFCGFEIQKQGRHNTGDWLRDEFDVLENGFVAHEILWQFGEPWRIVAESVEFSAQDRR